jgi:hypothetical protein
MLRMPFTILAPLIFVLSLVGTYAAYQDMFDVWLMVLVGFGAFFLRLPVPVELGHDVEGMLVAGFDPESQGYTLMHIHPCPDASQFLNMEPSSEFQTGEAYLNHLYQTGDTLLAQGSLNEVLDLAARWAQRPDALFPSCD